MSRTIVVIPTYNEAENLPQLAEALFSLPGLEVLVVDDDSPDGTGALAETLAARVPGKMHVLHRSKKQGLGTAYLQGFRWALDQGADAVLQMDADLSHDPTDIPRLLEALEGADVAIGSRYAPGGKLDESWGLGRRLLSLWANNVWVRGILGLPTHDATAGFRGWRRGTLLGLDLARVCSRGYIFQVEMTYLASRLGYQIREIPICFADRKNGRSKMSLKVQIEAALRVIEVWLRHRRLSPQDRAQDSTQHSALSTQQNPGKGSKEKAPEKPL